MFDNSYYGNFRTRKFTDIIPDLDTFLTLADSVEIKVPFANPETMNLVYYLLYARYGNSHIANYLDENQFIYSLFSTLFMYGPTWEKRLDIQSKLRALTEDDIIKGTKSIYNHSFNPSTAPSTSTLEELTTINDQNTSNIKRGKVEAYSMLYSILETDVSEDFINEFKKLFIIITAPDYPLYYVTDLSERED